MVWVNIFALLILGFSAFGGLKDGAVKHGFNLLMLLVVIPITGSLYRITAGILSFLPGENWQNFLGFFITMGILTALASLILLLPRSIIGKLWKKDLISRLIGGAMNFISAGIGLAVFFLVLRAYPVWDWLATSVAASGVMRWAVASYGFIQEMLPEVFRLSSVTVSLFQ